MQSNNAGIGLNDSLERYREVFKEQFPLMACLGMTEEEIAVEVQKCIDTGKVYEYDTKRFY